MDVMRMELWEWINVMKVMDVSEWMKVGNDRNKGNERYRYIGK